MAPSSPEIKSGPLTAHLGSRTSLGAGVVDLVFALRQPERLQFHAGQFVSLHISEPGATALKRRFARHRVEMRYSFFVVALSAVKRNKRYAPCLKHDWKPA